MKPKTLILMGVAITCGLGASYMTSRLLAERQVEEPEKVLVLVAKKSLNMGDTVKVPEEMFQEKQYSKGEEPIGAIADVKLLKDRILKRPLRTGDFVTPEDLMSGEGGDAMHVKLPPGFRAVGVRVNIESSAFGFASLPLSRVDIISTVRRGDDKATYSQVLLENVLVLAADDKTQRDESGKPMPTQVVTLALKPEDALRVALASEMGNLRLMLRKMSDTSRVEHGKLTYEGLRTGGDVEVEAPAPVVVQPEPKPEPKVEVAEVKPAGRTHRLWISEGEQTRQTVFLLNEQDQVIHPEETRSEPRPAPPAPAPAPQPTAPTAPPAPAPTAQLQAAPSPTPAPTAAPANPK